MDSFKCLGVVFSANMSWDNHVDHVINKLARITGVVGRLRYILPKSVKLLLYNSLFYSNLNYCQLVWGTAKYSSLHKVYLLQKKFLRHVYNKGYREPTRDLFLKSGVIKIFNLYNYRLSNRFKIETKININYMRNLARLQQKEISYPFRNKETWAVPTSRLNTGKERIQCTLPSLLNVFQCADFDIYKCSKRQLRVMCTKLR